MAVHHHRLAARRVRAVHRAAAAVARATQERHRPLHEVAAAVLRRRLRGRGWAGGWGGHAAAVVVGRVRVGPAGAVHGLGVGEVDGGDVGAGGGGGGGFTCLGGKAREMTWKSTDKIPLKNGSEL